jgi:hypothetical protein
MSECCKCKEDICGTSFTDVDEVYCRYCAERKIAEKLVKQEEAKGNKFIDTDGREVEPLDWVEYFMVKEIKEEVEDYFD